MSFNKIETVTVFVLCYKTLIKFYLENDAMDKNSLLKTIPKVDLLMDQFDTELFKRHLLKRAINNILDFVRNNILQGKIIEINKLEIIEAVKGEYAGMIKGSLESVVNATGIVIHTNLGRSPISEKSFDNIKGIVCGYSNLEYDIEKGERGERYHHIKQLLKLIANAEDAVIVNNNAAAVFLILNTFSKDKETIVSRGELIEIGGSFRIPDVMEGSGTILKEVGTTNKTKVNDYEVAINNQSAMIMKVHTSNYKIIGFTEEVPLIDITKIASKNNIVSYYDAGSGSLGVSNIESCEELSLSTLMDYGFDIVSASGDKMLGGPQAGIIIGKKVFIEQIKKNPLMRMLRVDKLTLSLLQETLKAYLLEKENDIPVIHMLNQDIAQLKQNATKLKKLILKKTQLFDISIQTDRTYVGGGSCPMSEIDTVVLEVQSDKYKASEIERKLRKIEIPVIGRIKNDIFILDVRTIFDHQFEIVAKALSVFDIIY